MNRKEGRSHNSDKRAKRRDGGRGRGGEERGRLNEAERVIKRWGRKQRTESETRIGRNRGERTKGRKKKVWARTIKEQATWRKKLRKAENPEERRDRGKRKGE